ncbi:uncharacterized protein LOC116165500 isoform X3 [Photinus pyralis]|uniref:uncharacterized protein LOC116165500 isoform X3 n=1 Tax=Photinus pyralis TaxID=7054 RepID=UPI0012672B03|nr:uncharacterized protein LOC116165500 isoform X3 [Photinus pyralis]
MRCFRVYCVFSFKMKYAVVCFLDEVVDNEMVVSEVPATWLFNNNTFCKWPPNHQNIHINKGTIPKDNWTIHRVRCESICDSLELARKRCTIVSSSDECGKGMRKKKPTKHYQNYYRTCESPPSFDDVQQSLNEQGYESETPYSEKTDSHNSEASYCPNSQQTGGHMDSFQPSLDAERSMISTNPVVPIDVDPLSYNSDHTNNSMSANIPLVMRDTDAPPASEILYQIPRQIPNITYNSTSCVEKKLDQVLRMLTAIKLDLDELKLKNGKTNQPDQVSIPEFPLQSVEDLETFERNLQTDEEFKVKVIKYFKYVGGTSLRDITTRCLKKSFTNSLCEKCSWKGWRNNNYKVEDLILIKCLYDAISSVFQCTEKEFEIMVRDYLRHGKQRREREEKNKSKNDVV